MRKPFLTVFALCCAISGTASGFEDESVLFAVPQPPSKAARQRHLPEQMAAVAKSGWEDALPATDSATGQLMTAIRSGNAENVRTALAAGALANAADDSGERPLVLGVATGNPEIVRQLLQRGASPNVKGAQGRTPLGLAAALGYPEMARMLIKAGAKLDVASDNRSTPLHEAVRFDHPEIVAQLVTAGADLARYDGQGLHPLALAAYLGRLGPLKVLLATGVSPDLPDKKGLTAIFWSRRQHQALAEVLLQESGASRDAWPVIED